MKKENEKEQNKTKKETSSTIRLSGLRSFLRNATCSYEISFAGPKYSPAMFNEVSSKEEEKKRKESERILRESRFPSRDKLQGILLHAVELKVTSEHTNANAHSGFK